jgi:dihydrodipicolinate synthase/N-acetylneuraminate lyase
VFLYNIPQFTNPLELETALDLLATGAFAGIKDSGGSWEYFKALQRVAHERDLAVYMGSDSMYSRARRFGAAGAISGTASVLPELMVAVDRRARAGEDTAALDAQVVEFDTHASCVPFPVAYKAAAEIRGLTVGPAASPLGSEEARRLDEFRAWFREWLPEVLKVG